MATNEIDPLPIREGLGKANMDIFFHSSEHTPVCYYFEDEGSEELYKRFISLIYPKQSDPYVVCVGGKTKTQVLDEATRLKISPVIMVVDKDYDDLIGEISNDDRVVTLNRYSFENYLLAEAAITNLAVENVRGLSQKEATKKLDMKTYFMDLYGAYKPLSALFVVARKFGLRKLKTTKQPIKDLLSVDYTLPQLNDINRFREKVLDLAQKAHRIYTDQDLDVALQTALNPKPKYNGHADSHPNAHLCGKHLLDLTLAYVDARLGTDLGKNDQFQNAMRMIIFVPKAAFKRVKEAITKSATKQNAIDSWFE